MTSTEAKPNQPEVVQTPLSKTYAEEELKRIIARRSQAIEKPSTSARL